MVTHFRAFLYLVVSGKICVILSLSSMIEIVNNAKCKMQEIAILWRTI